MPRLVVVAQADWLKSHQDEATRYVEMMLDANRQWQNNANAWIEAAKKIYPEAGLNDQDSRGVASVPRRRLFLDQRRRQLCCHAEDLEMFFKLRSESPKQDLSKPADIYETGPLQAALDKMGVVKGTAGLPDVPDWDGAKAAATK